MGRRKGNRTKFEARLRAVGGVKGAGTAAGKAALTGKGKLPAGHRVALVQAVVDAAKPSTSYKRSSRPGHSSGPTNPWPGGIPHHGITGVLQGPRVMIYDSATASRLASGGAFGKGILSRGEPNWSPIAPLRAVIRRWKNLFSRKDPAASPDSLVYRDKSPAEAREPVALGSCEAYWLVYALGLLVVLVRRPNGAFDSLSLDELWSAFRAADPAFPFRYAAYHSYRSRGWIIRSGLKLGLDFTLYRDLPDVVHADYAATVSTEFHPDSLVPTACPGAVLPSPGSWRYILNANRVSEGVGKGIVYTTIAVGPDVSPADLNSPAFLSKVHVVESLLTRFVPSAHMTAVQSVLSAMDAAKLEAPQPPFGHLLAAPASMSLGSDT